MSDPKATGGGSSGSKSRTGCSECKRKRVKCDEGKPHCGRCKRYPERCSYELKLSWTQGRPFKKPRTKEPWVTSLDVGVETDGSEVVHSALNEVESTDTATSTTEPQLSLPAISENFAFGVSTNKDFAPSTSSLQHSHTAAALQPLDDTTGFDNYEDSFLLPGQDALDDTTLLPVPSDFDFEPADETIERDVSLITYQHYSPPSEFLRLYSCHIMLTHTSSTTVLEPVSSPMSVGESECILLPPSLYHSYIAHTLPTHGAINPPRGLDGRSPNAAFAFSSSSTILRSSPALARKRLTRATEPSFLLPTKGNHRLTESYGQPNRSSKLLDYLYCAFPLH